MIEASYNGDFLYIQLERVPELWYNDRLATVFVFLIPSNPTYMESL